ncbi:unnamed protein product [Pleuronectes platessa]|uniref:Uncharacterized protein n=1 Tax=Pleuronectes platessa TaxID=8262 RepID=A0A9N7Y9L5_PLEPL|nr:unnamed protein product [Pleuronectes platessa]
MPSPLTVPVAPGVLPAGRAKRKRSAQSRDVQVLDEMTEPVHEPVRRLTALPQKLMQRHESWLLVSRTQADSVIQRDPALHLQSSAAHSNKLQNAVPKCRHGKDPLSAAMFQGTQDQVDKLSHASCEESSASAKYKTSQGSSAEPHWGLQETARCKVGRPRKS